MEGTLAWKRKMINIASMKPPNSLYNVVWVQQNTKMCKILKCKEWHSISMHLQKMLKNDVNKDQKRDKANTIENIAHDNLSQEPKSIPRLKTTKKSTNLQKRKKINRMCLE